MTPEDHISAEEHAEAMDERVGAGSPATAPWEGVEPPSWLRRQPLVALLVAIVLGDLGALVAELAAGATDPVVASLLGTVALVVAVGGRLAWHAVTPVAAPRLDADTPLVVR